MPFLLTTTERYELPIGTSSLGGEGNDAIPIAGLAEFRQGAIITVARDGTATIQLASRRTEVRVNGIPLGPLPRPLTEGVRIEYAGIRLIYAEVSRDDGVTDATAPRSSDPAADTAPGLGSAALARLVAIASGIATLIPGRGIAVGRDADCDVVLTARGASRRHAVVTVHDGAFTIVDESANGTFVNGERVRGSRALRSGDVLGFGAEEFRFEAVESSTASERAPARGASGAEGRAPARAPLATLRITRGKDAGTRFPVERPVSSIGRGEENDIRIGDESVSTAHASLLFKRGAWYVTDLRSANGTYVDGYRVAAERELPAGARLRVGKVEMTFQPVDATEDPAGDTKAVSGVARRMKKPR